MMSNRIVGVETYIRASSRGTWLDETRVSTRLSWYPRFAERRSSWRGPGADAVVVCVRSSDDALFGIGESRGGAVTKALIDEHLAPLIVGQDVGDVVTLADQMLLAAEPYAAGGLAAMAASAVELGLWDLTARAAKLPLCRLLGGVPKPLNTYLTLPNPAQFLDQSQDLSQWRIVKIPMPCGPADGAAGIRQNVELTRRIAELLGADGAVAIDCFMSWSEAYTLEYVAQLPATVRLAWIEEPLPMNDWAGYRRLRAVLGRVRVAGGEHVFGLAAALRFIERGCVDVVQTDVTWCGGLRASAVIGAAAEAHGLLFAPHDGAQQPWATHLLCASSPRALAEIVPRTMSFSEIQQPLVSEAAGIGLSLSAFGV